MARMLEQGRLWIVAGTKGRPALLQEMGAFGMERGRRGSVRFGGRAAHDDLVVAVALACWWARPTAICGEVSDGRLV